MKVIGVTGGLGTGKTTVARVFGRLGGRVLDADRIALKALRKGGVAYRKVIGVFGRDILDKTGDIDRGALAAKAFSSRGEVARLNAIVHPYVRRMMRGEILSAGGKSRARHIVIDAPLLIEAGLTRWLDALVVVTAGPGVGAARSVRKGKLTRAEVKRRSRCQLPLRKKEMAADFIIDNSGSLRETEKQAEKVWKEIIND